MADNEKITSFRVFLKKFKGIQGIALICIDNRSCFIVNIYQKQYMKTKNELPHDFEGIPIETRKIIGSRFLNLACLASSFYNLAVTKLRSYKLINAHLE
jgi:hypothetical protein